MVKRIIPVLDLDTKNFEEAVVYCLNKTGKFALTTIGLSGRKKEFGRFLFALGNSDTSKRKVCPACNAYHYHFVRCYERNLKEDEKGLCPTCGCHLVAMTLLKVPEEKMLEWMKCCGSINPYDLMQIEVEKLIKSGGIELGKWN